MLDTAFHLFSFDMWDVKGHLIGLFLPMVFSLYLIYKIKPSLKSLLAGVGCVAYVSFCVTTPIVEVGMVSYFPYNLLPVVLGFVMTLPDCKGIIHRLALSYIFVVLGVFIGADVFHLPWLLSTQPDVYMNAILGGAGITDFIFLSGVLVCLLVMFHSLSLSLMVEIKNYHFVDINKKGWVI